MYKSTDSNVSVNSERMVSINTDGNGIQYQTHTEHSLLFTLCKSYKQRSYKANNEDCGQFSSLFFNSLGASLVEKLSPLVRIKQFCLKLRCEISVGKSRRVVLVHVVDRPGALGALPRPPKPLTGSSRALTPAIAGDRIHTPVEEDSKLGLVIPRRECSIVQRVPRRLELCPCGNKATH